MKILLVTPRLPYPPLKGDQVIAYHRLRTLSARHEVQLLSLYETDAQLAQLGELKTICAKLWPVKLSRLRSLLNLCGAVVSPLPGQLLYYRSRALADAARRIVAQEGIDVIHAVTLRIAPSVRDIATPIVFELVDSMRQNLGSRRRHARPLMRVLIDLELGRAPAYERALAERFPTIVVSAIDAAAIGGCDIEVVPNGVDLRRFSPDSSLRSQWPTVVFTGNMSYEPNVTAAVWFAERCFPAVRAAHPDARFLIGGHAPARAVRVLARQAGVEVLGYVPDMGAVINRAWVAVAPMQSGSGMQNKILEAMACGVPVVTTTRGLGAIKARDGIETIVADDAGQFGAATAGLLAEPKRAAAIGTQGAALAARDHSWEAAGQRVETIYQRLLAAAKPFGTR